MNKFCFWKNETLEQNNKILQNMRNYLINLLYIEKQDITIKIKITKKSTSDKARGYIWAEIIPKALQGLRELGNDIQNNENGKEYVYQYLKAQGGFFKIKKVKLKNGDEQSFADFETFGKNGDLKRQTEFIDFCIRFCSENLGVVIQESQDWKIKRGII